MMRTFTFTLLLMFFATASLMAQCVFDATVTPANLILCPNESDTLWTQQYDSFQWYRDGMAIPGATQQYLVVEQFADAGYEFFVAVTDDNCTENSDTVLVDGWAFLPPFIITDGNFTIGPNGEVLVCNGDSVLLILGLPYDTNIEWTNNGIILPGLSDDTLVVTQPGNYTASGAPSICPGFVQGVGVEVEVQFTGPPTPVITQNGNMLETAPGYTYQWFLDGNPVGGNTNQVTITGNGNYTVVITDNITGCSAESMPFVITSVTEIEAANFVSVVYFPSMQSVVVTREGRVREGTIMVSDMVGRIMLLQPVLQGEREVVLNVSGFAKGVYFVIVPGEGEAAKVVVE